MSRDEGNRRIDPASSPGGSFAERLSPDRARQILGARFSNAGVALDPAVAITVGDTDLVLDGYNTKRRIGYRYIAADRENNEEHAESVHELAESIARMAYTQQEYILLVFEGDVPTVDALERRIDGFFASLPPLS
ncbi:MAG: hypothetical protein MJE77_48075 [Proteobacteria bacterium]|nr:hypothetical protein [Pseudomonadota bacterium]